MTTCNLVSGQGPRPQPGIYISQFGRSQIHRMCITFWGLTVDPKCLNRPEATRLSRYFPICPFPESSDSRIGSSKIATIGGNFMFSSMDTYCIGTAIVRDMETSQKDTPSQLEKLIHTPPCCALVAQHGRQRLSIDR